MNMINAVSTAAVTLASAAPSIGSSAMLVELQISQWTGRKKDKRASATVTTQNYADKGTAAVKRSYSATARSLTPYTSSLLMRGTSTTA